MKVTVKFNNRREQFDGVEVKTFQQFRDDVYIRFGIEPSSDLSFKMGNDVINLEPDQSLSEFGVVSGDVLYLSSSHPYTAVNIDTGSNVVGLSASTSASLFTNPPCSSQLASTTSSKISTAIERKDEFTPFPDNNLDGFCIGIVESFFKKHGYENKARIRLPEDDSMFFLFEYCHSYASTKVQLSLIVFRDDSANNKVTSLHITGMLITTTGERHLQESMLIGKNIADTEEEIETMVIDSLLLPVKERMLGPDNAFLRFLSQGYLTERFLRYLTSKDLVHIEETCKYAKWKCRSSKLIDETIWKPLLGKDAPQKVEYPQTYRAIYQDKMIQLRQLSEEARRAFDYRPPFNPHFFIQDDNWFMRQPFRQLEPFRTVPSPLDPFTGGLLIPQRPGRQLGQPRIYPHRPLWDDPNRLGGDEPFDPDMPQGPQRNSFGQGLPRPGFGETDIQQGFGFSRRGDNRPRGGGNGFPSWM